MDFSGEETTNLSEIYFDNNTRESENIMRKNIIILLVLTLCFVVTVPVFGKNLESQGEKMSSPSFMLKDQPIKIDEKFYEHLRSIKEKNEKEMQSQEKNIEPLDTAPALYYLEVYAAISSQHPEYEYFEPDQLSSVQDHGGGEMYIVTVELGYGHLRFAKMYGSYLLDSVNFQSIDLDNDSIVDGWFYWWDASEYESGNFSYENTSSNYPYNKMYDSIYIK